MPITPASPYPKSAGDAIRSQDWNQAVDEIIRLDNAKLNRAGDTITGDLTVNGSVGIGTTPDAPLHVAQFMTVGPFVATTGEGGIDVTGSAAEFGFVRRTLTAWPNTPAAGDRFVWYNPDGTARLWSEVVGDLLRVSTNGNLELLTGDLSIPKSAGGSAIFSHSTFSNEASFKNNIKVIMGHQGFFLPGAPPFEYEFLVGHTTQSFVIGGGFAFSFQKRFGINQNGDLSCSGSKAGYVVDHFINRAGDTLEQGDVVVIGDEPVTRFIGTGNNIPLPEVDLTDRAYDTRVCGIVDKVLTEADLPFVEQELDPKEQARLAKEYEKMQKGTRRARALAEAKLAESSVARHPLSQFAARSVPGLDMTQVSDQQIGHMVTLGTFSHCKVDADIAPIAPGDLLTTSPTKGHAQKADPAKAAGAIIGKALGGLKKGKGKIPVLVTLH